MIYIKFLDLKVVFLIGINAFGAKLDKMLCIIQILKKQTFSGNYEFMITF